MNRVRLNLLVAVLLIQLLAYTAYGQTNPCDKTMAESLQQVASVLSKPESKALWGGVTKLSNYYHRSHQQYDVYYINRRWSCSPYSGRAMG